MEIKEEGDGNQGRKGWKSRKKWLEIKVARF